MYVFMFECGLLLCTFSNYHPVEVATMGDANNNALPALHVHLTSRVLCGDKNITIIQHVPFYRLSETFADAS